MSVTHIEPVATQLQVPPGMLGPDPVNIEVRCFVVVGMGGVVLVDTGPPGTGEAIGIRSATWRCRFKAQNKFTAVGRLAASC